MVTKTSFDPWPETYAVFDIETDGLDTDTCLPTEVAIMCIKDRIVIDAYESLIWRSNNNTIPEHITRITGITLDECQTRGRPMAEVFNRFWALAQHFPLVGHNIFKFDCPIIDRFRPPWAYQGTIGADTTWLFRHYKRSGTLEWPPSDVIVKFMGNSGREKFKYNLKVACDELGLRNLIEGHRAMIDVENNRVLYEEMRKKAGV